MSVMSLQSAHAVVNLLTNGSFETGINPGGYTTLNGGDSASISGWTVGSHSVDYIGSYWQAGQGNRSIDLNGDGLGAIAQQFFATIVGQTYNISFMLAGNPDGGPVNKTVDVIVNGGVPQSFSFNTTGYSAVNMGWSTESFNFVAGINLSSIAFQSTTTTNGPYYGPAIDNVIASAVPEASTWAMMLLGFAGIGFMTLRRRRNSAVRAV